MIEALSMSILYKKLSAIGFSENYIRKSGLPSWWDDSLNDKPVAVLEGAGHIAKRLNLDLQSLLSDDREVCFKTTDKMIPTDTILSMYSAGCDIEDIADELYCTPEQVKLAIQGNNSA